ncbi:hypothetical protein LINPERPRIM_LOCUS3770 [Linum perenne]
MKFLQTFCWKS